MKKCKNKNILSRGNIIAIAAMFLLGLFSFVGQYFYSDEVTIGTALLLTFFEVSLLALSIALAIKAKSASDHIIMWRRIEFVSLAAYVFFAFVFSSSLLKFVLVVSEKNKPFQRAFEGTSIIDGSISTFWGWFVFTVLHLLVLLNYFAVCRTNFIRHHSTVESWGGISLDADDMISNHASNSTKVKDDIYEKGKRWKHSDISFVSSPSVSFNDKDTVYSSIFAPAETKQKSHMLVQVYLHLYEETEMVRSLAQESDKNAERRDYIPLQCKLKKGDKVDVSLSIYGDTLLLSEQKSFVWQGSFTKCGFDYFVPKDIDVDELSCMALLTVNGIPVGEMRFITKIVESPRKLNPEIVAHKYNKVFISYAHKDEAKVKSFHEGLKLAGVEHFFDRSYLQIGDIFPQVIQDYISSADLFVLFWSENASKSEYVQKERIQALKLAFPQMKPQQAAKLSIYPMSIEPRAELPSDMRDNYHFGEL